VSATRIIGIDPGLVSTGWGVIERNGSSLSFIACGTIAPKTTLALSERLLVFIANSRFSSRSTSRAKPPSRKPS
jgi:hypothetical protein